ncbi:MAG: tRNA 2-thiouridine(34) synthase MnmA [Planctomycetaceae bacterium]|nr:tRNA 2-thiouridine(34) synthase MnmA [Planctomycetaceae bacterium]
MRVVLAMSGGVDSSASALLLQRQGHEVVGLFMRSGATEEACATDFDSPLPIIGAKSHKQGCCSAADAADARRVADRLDIPFHAINFSSDFNRIRDYFADEYLAGRTPNPCVMCNNWLKFGKLWDFARQVGAGFIASGHYAQLAPRATDSAAASSPASDSESGTTSDQPAPALIRGTDRGKDQSYVLFGIRRELLPHILFPVGSYQKPEIRSLAQQAGLRTASKPDSQEICFIPDQDYAGFIERHRGHTETSGELVDTAGQVLGQHEGYERFTIGQRKGLGITFGEPRYVVGIDAESRQVTIGRREDLERTTLTASRTNWLVDPPSDSFRCLVQIRYRHTAAPATVTLDENQGFQVQFDEPQTGVAPGQAVVCYEAEQVLGGGWIC